MTRTNANRIIIEAIAAIFILLLTYTAIAKFQDLGKFQRAIGKMPVLNQASTFWSIAVPSVELLTALLLFIPATRLIGFICSLALMLIFTFYIAAMLWSSSDLPCSCGGVISSMTWGEHLTFNIAFTILAAIGGRLQSKQIFMAINRSSRIPV